MIHTVKVPCRGCKDRAAECKPSCPKWLEYEAGKEIEYAERQKIFEVNMAISEHRERACRIAHNKGGRLHGSTKSKR